MKTTGHYIDYGVHNRNDFEEKMQQGMSLEDYKLSRQSQGIHFTVPGAGISGRNRYIVFSYEVDGKTYYGCSTTAYSFDIINHLAGTPCEIEYDEQNPYRANISKNDASRKGIGVSIACMITGLVSGALSIMILPGIACSIASIILFIMSMKQKKEGTNNPAIIMSIVGIIFGGIGLISSIIMLMMYVVVILAYFMQ